MKRLFQKYINSVLSPDEFSKIEAFLEEKDNNESIYRLMTPAWKEAIEGPSTTIRRNPELLLRIKKSIFQEKHRLAQQKIKFYSIGLRVAAILVVALLINNIFLFKKYAATEGAGFMQTVNVPYGAKSQVTLPDGSLVWLNSGSTLTYPLTFKKERPVRLKGEAFFEVVKDKTPFIVQTLYGKVSVKGTSFNVKAFSDDNSFVTTLVEGAVVLSDDNGTKQVTLKPGEQGVNSADGFLVEAVETKFYTSWKEGKLLFNHESFPNFIRKLERWYNVEINYCDPKLDELWYSGTLEMESISEVMEMISKAAPVTYHFDHKTRVFTINAK